MKAYATLKGAGPIQPVCKRRRFSYDLHTYIYLSTRVCEILVDTGIDRPVAADSSDTRLVSGH